MMKYKKPNKISYITNKIIENEFFHAQNEDLKGMEDLEKYKKISEDNDEIYSILIKALPKDMQDKLKKLKEQRPHKFYEFKGIVDTLYAIKTGKQTNE